jgi:hypothetical protein
MATFYLDFEAGNDANDGTTFANRWKTLTSGATAARIAHGDIIRIMGSPAPTSLGQNGVWTSQVLQATKAITGATNANPISITCTAHGYSTGDTVVITGVGGNTNANGTWEITSTGANTFTLDGSAGNGIFTSGGTARLRNNTRVMLTTAVTQNIASTGPGRAAWDNATNTTTSLNTTTFKEHNASDSIVIAEGFGTGNAATYNFPSTLNLSGYQQVSFWIQQSSGTVGAAGAVSLELCTSPNGSGSVHTINIPNLAVTGRWMPVTVDLGTAMNSALISIAFRVNTDNGAQTFLLSNIIACKASSAADSLTLTSLIGKNTTDETFWGIQSINGRRVMLDADTAAQPTTTTLRGYYGTSETVTTWKRETIKLGPAAASTTALQTIQDSGTDGSPITFSGGWDRTNMSTQNLETWLDGVNGNGLGIQNSAKRFVSFSKIAVIRFSRGIDVNSLSSRGCVYDLVAANNNTSFGLIDGGNGNNHNILFACANASLAIQYPGLSSNTLIAKTISNGSAGVQVAGGPATLITVTSGNNGAAGISASLLAPAVIRDSVFADNATAGLSVTGLLYCINCLVSNSTEFQFNNASDSTTVFSQKHDQVADNHKVFMHGGLISSATDQRHTASGISWKIQPTSTERTSAWPVVLSLAKVACAANALVTIKAWMRRDNSGLTMRLVCKGGQIAGVTNDVTASVTTTNAWEELTITFTPTEIGVVEITAEAWGGTTFSGWVDDLTISQA